MVTKTKQAPDLAVDDALSEDESKETKIERLILPWDSEGIELVIRHKGLTYEMFAKQQTVVGDRALNNGPLKGKLVDVKYTRSFCAYRIAQLALGVLQTEKEQNENAVPTFDRVTEDQLIEFFTDDVLAAMADIIENRKEEVLNLHEAALEKAKAKFQKLTEGLPDELKESLLKGLVEA